MRTSCVLCSSLLLCFIALAVFAANAGPTLLAGVKEIAAPGWPGALSVFGPEAEAVVVGTSGAKTYAPEVAITRYGKCRLVAFGHDGYFGAEALGTADTGRLMLNAVRWAAQQASPTVGVRNFSELADFLKAHGLKVISLSGPDWTSKLSQCEVACLTASSFEAGEELRALSTFWQSGGGLVMAETGWGWLQLHPGKTLVKDHPGNLLTAPAGLVWCDGGLGRTSSQGFITAVKPPALINASSALDALQAMEKGQRKLSDTELAQAGAVLMQAARAIPPTDTLLRPRLTALREQYLPKAVPSPKHPLTLQQPLERLALTLELDRLKTLPVDQVKANPAAEFFPGAVPPEAPRVTRTIEIATSVPDWHSTGLYAAPGEILPLTLPPGAENLGLGVRIGCHTDQLYHLSKWERVPEISLYWPLKQRTTQVASPFGGLVYITVPRSFGNQQPPATVAVTIKGAVQAPLFILGKTSLEEWRTKERNYPAPWGEVGSSKVIITVPSKVLRTLDDPVTLMKFWNKVLDADADLAGWPRKRLRPERYVCDQQISAGYMHSGYPIMTFLDVIYHIVDVNYLKSDPRGGSWGFFHEMGHNHQSPDWTFSGTTEVTVNLFSMYVLDTVCGVPIDKGHPALDKEQQRKRLVKYLQNGAHFSEWKRDPFLALTMYIQLQQAFGWDAYRRVFKEYRALPDALRPKTDAEKRDQWLIRFSRTVGRNLGPFFDAWGVPTSKTAHEVISDLPVWMPPDWPQVRLASAK